MIISFNYPLILLILFCLKIKSFSRNPFHILHHVMQFKVFFYLVHPYQDIFHQNFLIQSWENDSLRNASMINSNIAIEYFRILHLNPTNNLACLLHRINLSLGVDNQETTRIPPILILKKWCRPKLFLPSLKITSQFNFRDIRIYLQLWTSRTSLFTNYFNAKWLVKNLKCAPRRQFLQL